MLRNLICLSVFPHLSLTLFLSLIHCVYLFLSHLLTCFSSYLKTRKLWFIKNLLWRSLTRSLRSIPRPRSNIHHWLLRELSRFLLSMCFSYTSFLSCPCNVATRTNCKVQILKSFKFYWCSTCCTAHFCINYMSVTQLPPS